MSMSILSAAAYLTKDIFSFINFVDHAIVRPMLSSFLRAPVLMSYINLKRAAVSLCIILPCSFFCTSTCSATGFLIYNQHAAANASAIAYTAQVDNPSAVFYNPAAINQLSGTQTSCG